MKDDDQYKIYEKARKRTKQKKRLYTHFILFLVGSVFFVVLNKVMNLRPEHDWFVWAIFAWLFLLTLHFINVFVTNRFFGKDWVEAQTKKLIEKHQIEVDKLEKTLEEKGAFIPNNSEEETI